MTRGRLWPALLFVVMTLAGQLSPSAAQTSNTSASPASNPSAVAVSESDRFELERLEQQTLRRAAEQVADSVVRIEVIGGMQRPGEPLVSSAPTSGLVVDRQGYIVSSVYSFVQKPASILVTTPAGNRRAAEIVSTNDSRKLVLLKIEPDDSLVVPQVAPKSEVRVGQWVVTVGRTLPDGELNMTLGIVSATDRIWGKAVQTDANVSPSNYGGALVDILGRVVGVLVPLSPDSSDDLSGTEWYDSGIGFAIPLSDIFEQLDLMKERDLSAGKLGISLKSSDMYGSETVIGVSRPNSPAREAGLQAGDKIVKFNGESVRRPVHFKQLLGPLLGGQTVAMQVERDGQQIDVQCTLADELRPYEHAFLGFLPARPLTEDEPPQTGPTVRFVFPDSPAAEAGLQAGDRIIRLGDTEITSSEDLRLKLAELAPQTQIKLQYSRADEAPNDEAPNDKVQNATVTLADLTGAIPDSLPPPKIDRVPDADLPPLGKLEIKLPEEPGNCTAYIPTSYDPRLRHGLMVILPIPGDEKPQPIIDAWRTYCDERQMLLLIPEAQDDKAWLPTEVEFVRKTIENLRQEYRIDPSRIAICGTKSSGAMAFLSAFTLRDLIRGVAAIDAPVPRAAPSIFNEPLQRLTVWVATTESPARQVVEGQMEQLREAKLPVGSREIDEAKLDDSLIAELARWLDSLDRL